ncbi:OsmC/Ohr family domain-containing protein [Synechococcus sp. PROS-7-1]|uniref:OsmC family protein n=1 Tax=Synechococcus sp. PROS-7-1 TaxID=1442556 RepID=UPI001644CC2A|nr:OsmC family protein [Synechococcus sp. PROS-7-1]QNI84942.1 OsmC/Ohr family domain-containing protein [Synechococcus sp. PROS-7-1]
MTNITCTYTGDLHCEATHSGSGARLSTDAPLDNEGKGEAFSPTDLLATSLGTCMLTIMGITARSRGWSLEGASASVDKVMSNDGPRRIDTLRVTLQLPEQLDHDQRALLQRVAEQCPVKRSIVPLINAEIHWA